MRIDEINREVIQKSEIISLMFNEIQKVIVGQDYMIQRILVGLLADGHILLEGVPGLAKTLTVSTIAKTISASFNRIQFTPDLLPADLIGTLIYNQKDAEFYPKKGPLFTNFVLADEINRAPAKVQSALLEAMQERQITIGDSNYKLPKPFLVMATQNPIEQEGTYPLPEAQVDRFMLKLNIQYPTKEQEKLILQRMVNTIDFKITAVIRSKDVLSFRKLVEQIYIEQKVEDYILDLVFATREPSSYENLKELTDLIECGASPRATIYLAKAAKAHAFLSRRGFVTPDDVKAVGKDVLRHRIILTYEAEAEQVSQANIVEKLFEEIQVP